jgi:hypothetical protein
MAGVLENDRIIKIEALRRTYAEVKSDGENINIGRYLNSKRYSGISGRYSRTDMGTG